MTGKEEEKTGKKGGVKRQRGCKKTGKCVQEGQGSGCKKYRQGK
jgi:hypothetical protein